MNLDQIIETSFKKYISNRSDNYIIKGLTIDDLVKIKFPNPLLYINLQEKEVTNNDDNATKKIKKTLIGRNHPRIREIPNFVFYDKKLIELDYGSYNYSIFKDTFNNKFHIAFGKVTSCLELGVKHSIISKGFPIYLAGEIKKVLNNNKDIYSFNFNSSNFNITNIREMAFIKLNELSKNNLIDELGLRKNNINENESKEDKKKYEKFLINFYNIYIKKFFLGIFKKYSGYNNITDYDFDYVTTAQDIYIIRKQAKYYEGLHDCYTNEPGYDENTINLINNKGNLEDESEKISRMCVNINEKNCPQDNEQNIIDVLEELFIQLIYQRSLLGNNNIWIEDQHSSLIKFNIIDAINKADFIQEKYSIKKLNENNKNTIITKYLTKWFYRYISKNFLFLTNFNHNDNVELFNFQNIDSNEQQNLLKEFMIIKILVFAYMRLELCYKIDKCIFYKLNEPVKISYYLLINKIKYYFNFETYYINFLLLDKIKYINDNNSNFIDEIVSKYLSSLVTEYNNKIILDNNTILHDIDRLLITIPLPLNFKYNKKYLKYKLKYVNLKSKLNNKN